MASNNSSGGSPRGSGEKSVPLEHLSSTPDVGPLDDTIPPDQGPHGRILSGTTVTDSPPVISPNPLEKVSSRSSSYFPRGARGSVASSSRSLSLTPAQMHSLAKTRSNSLTPRTPSLQRPSLGANIDEVTSDEEEGREIDLAGLLEDPYYPPLPTTKCLQQFAKVVARQVDPEVQRKKEAKSEYWKKERRQHDITLEQVRAWAAAKQRKSTIKGFLLSLFDFGFAHRLPNSRSLIDLAKYHHPMRGELTIYVCDFGDNRFEKQEVTFGEIDEYMYNKPEWSIVRWIHAPLNIGLVHSSLEDRFLVVEREKAKSHTTDVSWPYAQLETLALRKRTDLEAMRDIQRIYRRNREFDGVNKELDAAALDGMGKDMLEDLQWRAGHVRVGTGYWDLVGVDFQRQLANGPSLHINYLESKLATLDVQKQAISSLPFYSNIQIVRYCFRCFHRSDGFLLTMAPMPGLDFQDADLDQHLDTPKEVFFDNEHASVIGLMFELFSKTGTSTWYKKSVEWFMVYLITEIAATPNNIRQGGNAPQFGKAYQLVVQDLKDRRYLDFKRNESVKLVREYLSCIDELTTVGVILTNTIAMLEGLLSQIEKYEKEDPDSKPDNPEGESPINRVMWALAVVREESILIQGLLADLKQSLTALFQLRSIEQNELAIVADIQNKAILVFTGVTIVFLPLSFFTSYYGMNLQGIVNTVKTERYFWKVCGTIGFCIILVVSLYAFRHKLRSRVMIRMKAQEHMV